MSRASIQCCNKCLDCHVVLRMARTLALDIAHGQRGWVCCRGYPPDILPCPAVQLPMPALDPQPWPAPQPLPSTQLPPQPQQQQPRQEQQRPSPEPVPAPQQPQQMQRLQAQTPARPGASWFSRGPPATSDAAAGANSWLFVPLLQAAPGICAERLLSSGKHMPFLGQCGATSTALHRQAIFRALEVHQAVAALEPTHSRRAGCGGCVATSLRVCSGQSSVFCAWAVEHCMLADASLQARRPPMHHQMTSCPAPAAEPDEVTADALSPAARSTPSQLLMPWMSKRC